MAFLFLLFVGFSLFISGFSIAGNANSELLGWVVSGIGIGIGWLAFKVDSQILDYQAKTSVKSGKYSGKKQIKKTKPTQDTSSYKAGKAVSETVNTIKHKKTSIISKVSNTKFCNYCDERIKKTAKKCKHCGEWVS